MTWSFSRNTLLLVGGMSVISFAIGFAMPNFPLYVELLGANSSEFGILIFVKMAALFITMVPGGWFSDTFGPKRALLLTGFADIGGWFVLSVVTTWHWVAIYSVLSGTSWGIATGAWYVILANENPTQDGMPNISAFSLGVVSHLLPDAIGSGIGIWFFKLSGDVYTRPVLGTTFKLGTVCSLVSLGFYALIRTPEPSDETAFKQSSFFDFFKKTDRVFLGFLISNLFAGLGTGLIFDFFPLYFVERFQVPPSINSLLRFLSSFLIASTTLAASTIAQKLGRVTTVCLAKSFILPPLVLLAQERKRLWLAMAAYIARGIFLHVAWPILSSVTMSVLEEEDRGKGGSLWDLFWSGGYLVTPPVSGRWIQAQGFAPSFYFAVVFNALSTIIFYVAARWSLSEQDIKVTHVSPAYPTKKKSF